MNTQFRLRVETVLWSRLCGKGAKVKAHDTLEHAIAYIESIEPGLRMDAHAPTGEIRCWDGYDLLATIKTSIEEP